VDVIRERGSGMRDLDRRAERGGFRSRLIGSPRGLRSSNHSVRRYFTVK
jgi:hypothetical protein